MNLGENLFFDAIATIQAFPNLEHSLWKTDTDSLLMKDFNYVYSPEKVGNPKFDIFLNVASFGEMDMKTIEYYFRWMKSHASGESYLYHRNRESKLHPDGSVISCLEYPMDILNDVTLVAQICDWCNDYPTGKVPFYKSFDGRFLEFLVRWSQ